MGHDGFTARRRLSGRPWKGIVDEFGEQVMGKLAKKKRTSMKNAERGKTKLTAQRIRGTWVGIHLRTGEHFLAVHTGEVVRVRIIHRLPAQKQWNAEAVKAIRATPRCRGTREDPEPRLFGESQ